MFDRMPPPLVLILAFALGFAPIAAKTVPTSVVSGRMGKFRRTIGVRLDRSVVTAAAPVVDCSEFLLAADEGGRNRGMKNQPTLVVQGMSTAFGTEHPRHYFDANSPGGLSRPADAGFAPLRC